MERPHGDRARYISAKCRCPACRDANATYQRLFRAGQRGTNQDRKGPVVIAGTPTPQPQRTPPPSAADELRRWLLFQARLRQAQRGVPDRP